ncbi:MAG: hypothetical protein HQ582_33535 [Planctomycetes bacterium]|nr:hypothetical protein [Planctomycetota bacterium]
MALATGSHSAATLSSTGEILGDSEFVVLEPEEWIGKRFPLFRHIDVGGRLSEGDWVVVLYHHDCLQCQETVPEYHMLALNLAGESDAPRIALVEMPPYGEGDLLSNSPALIGKLNNAKDWFCETPQIVSLTDGYVVAHSSGNQVDGHRADPISVLTGGFNRSVTRRDCGPATLYCICRLVGKPYKLDSLKQLTETSSSGTTMLNLKDAASNVGFEVDARNGSWDMLQRHVQRPGRYAIVHATVDGSGHFVGIAGAVGPRSVRVVDVARGVRDLDEEGFAAAYDWKGHMLRLRAENTYRSR